MDDPYMDDAHEAWLQSRADEALEREALETEEWASDQMRRAEELEWDDLMRRADAGEYDTDETLEDADLDDATRAYSSEEPVQP
jgi:hypothetical protein